MRTEADWNRTAGMLRDGWIAAPTCKAAVAIPGDGADMIALGCTLHAEHDGCGGVNVRLPTPISFITFNVRVPS